MYTVAFI